VRRSAILLSLLLVVGCFRYTPSVAAETSAGDVVRIRLTDAGALRLAAAIGPQAQLVEGRLVSVADTGYVVAVSSVTRSSDSIIQWAGEPVTIPRDAIAATERRVLDAGRTALTAGVALAAVALTGKWVRGAGGGAGTDTGGPPSP
jgi:hypothetical protein